MKKKGRFDDMMKVKGLGFDPKTGKINRMWGTWQA